MIVLPVAPVGATMCAAPLAVKRDRKLRHRGAALQLSARGIGQTMKETSPPWEFVVMLGAALCALGYYFFRVQIVLNHLRDHHAETYRDMGSPHIIMNNGFRTGAAARRFIAAKDHDYFGDADLRRKASACI